MHFLSYSKTLALSALFSVVSFSSISSMELIAAGSVSSREPVQLFSNHRNIFAQDENAAYRVENHNMNPLLHEVMKRKAMGEFTENGGYLRVKQLSDGIYILEAKVRGDGGGPISGAIAYWATKTLCYGTAVAAATTAVVATGGAAGAATGAFVAGATAGASTGATVVAGAIAGGGLATEAATVTAAVVTSSGGIAGAIATVETGALAAGAFFTAIPFLP